MTAKIQVRRDTTANWTTNSSVVINAGEIAYDTDLNQIKIGSGATWASTPWLASTVPTIPVTSTDLNDVSNRVPGRYQFTAAAGSPTNGPITFALLDGMIAVSVTAHGNTLVQRLSTEGDGTSAFPPKHYIRLFDGGSSAWRGWVPLNVWGISSTEGTALVAKTIESKDTLTVAGASTLTGNVTVNGTTTLGNANDDIVTVQAGTAAAPIITTSGDTDTGFYFPAANQVAVTAAGVQQLLLNSGASDVLSAVFRKGATFNERVDMNGFRVIDVGDPANLTDVVNWQTLLSHISIVATASNGATTASNGSSWTVANIASNASFTPAVSGTFDGLIISFGNLGSHNSGITRTFNNLAVPVTTGGASNFVILIAIRRS